MGLPRWCSSRGLGFHLCSELRILDERGLRRVFHFRKARNSRIRVLLCSGHLSSKRAAQGFLKPSIGDLHNSGLRKQARDKQYKKLIIRCIPQQVEVVDHAYTEDIVEELVERLLQRLDDVEAGKKYIVGIAGPPGGGKSTIANAVCERINQIFLQQRGAQLAVVVPMDGFHYTKSELKRMDDPEEALLRRGAHWTFDGTAFVAALRQIRENGFASLPSFDHGVGDPVKDDVVVEKETRIVIVEGNYLFLDIEPWCEIPELLDEKWFVWCPLRLARRRIYRRHLRTGKSREEARLRIDANDGPNGELVQASSNIADVMIKTHKTKRKST